MGTANIEDYEHRSWANLVKWLSLKGTNVSETYLFVRPETRPGAGRGMYPTRIIQGSESAELRISSSCLLNVRTLAPLYPFVAEKLPLDADFNIDAPNQISATQLITLHLSLYRPSPSKDSPDPYFGPYISTLPREFDSHPLTWLVRRHQRIATKAEAELLDALPPSAGTDLQRVYKTFDADRKVVQDCLDVHREGIQRGLKSSRTNITVEDILWAWLCVNTRCLFLQIFSGQSHPSNLTLCPVIDLANHTSSKTVPQLRSRQAPNSRMPTDRPFDFTFSLSTGPARREVDQNDEIFLHYGDHSSLMLFVEYGFVEDLHELEFEKGEVDVTELVERMIQSKGEEVSDRTQSLLEDAGYWRDWRMHAFPVPAQPSWRMLTALRLVAANVSTSSNEADEIPKWLDCVSGRRSSISEENDQAVLRLVQQLCDEVIQRAEARRQTLTLPEDAKDDNIRDWSWELDNVKKLWEEERYVARLVLTSLDDGDVL